ncbi:esterase FE4-like [Prorops nasuta]|uniref:esterase FE4-like n=1 Tax=Prorops nasuta TaxID=863751 RepID=UPI0034CD9F9C
MKTCAILLLVLGSVFAEEEKPELYAPIGKIRGSVIKSRLGRDIYAFRGVRYAEPPTGVQRFQAPIPANDWGEEAFDASEEGPSCPQPGGKLVSEDCLRLNVYTTKLPHKDDKGNVTRPVLVFFHPGGFYVYSGQSSLFGPQYLLDKDIVLVTVNYRLATLGFISTGDSLAPGNLGLKDQVIALRWIQRNIGAFGGDADSVTISGYSVGGLSVMLHLLSPMSRGLFHRAISSSGSTLLTEPFPTEQKHLAKKQAELLGCPTDTTGNMIICLNTKPVENFTDTVSNFFEWHGDPIVLWKPVVEPEVNGVERFLPAQPVDLIKDGKIAQVPLIAGVTKDEFGGVVTTFVERDRTGNDSWFEDMNDNWTRIAPISFLYTREEPRSAYLSKELREFYFKEKPIDTESSSGLAHIYADSVIIFPMHRMAKLISTNSPQPVYFYEFTYQGRYSFNTWNNGTPYGVVHHDDLQYLYFISDRFPFFEKDAPEIPMVELITSIWTNFATTGEPLPKDVKAVEGVTWTKYSPDKDNYLDLNLEPSMKTGLYPERMQEWEKLFP